MDKTAETTAGGGGPRGGDETPSRCGGSSRHVTSHKTYAIIALASVFVVALTALVGIRLSSGPTLDNVLVISLCSVRPDHMSVYGYERRTTPAFENLARESLVFENAVSPWPKTAPAFAAVMSGKYGHTTGVMRVTPRQRLGDEHETLAEVLREKGYETAAFVSSPAINRGTNILQGFETIVETFRSPNRFAETSREAVAWLKRDRSKPFLLWAHYNNAHYPYHGEGLLPELFVDDEYYDPVRQVKLNRQGPLPVPLPDEHPFRRQILRPDIGGVHPRAILEERPTEYAFYVARYDAGIHAADGMAGELLDAVRSLPLFDDTVVVVVGDHGESLGEHNYYFEHGRFPYDTCAKVPLIIRPGGGIESQRVRAPVSILGLAPTLLEMLGIDAPKGMESESFWRVTRGRAAPEYVFTESGYQLDYTLSVRDGTWKLIRIPNATDRLLMQGTEHELYDLTEDPGETDNLFNRRDEVSNRLRRVLDDWSRPWIMEAYRLHLPPDLAIDEATLQRLRTLGYID